MQSKQDERSFVLLPSLGWWLALGVLSYGLCSPVPPRLGEAVIPTGWQFFASKCVHVGAFTLMALTASLLARTTRYRVFLIVTLLCHGALTEYIQTFVEGRHGCIQDVGINWT